MQSRKTAKLKSVVASRRLELEVRTTRNSLHAETTTKYNDSNYLHNLNITPDTDYKVTIMKLDARRATAYRIANTRDYKL